MRKAIITAAITGSIHTPTMSPHLPITPQQIIDEILAVHEAGGTVCHVHARDPKTGQPVTDLGIYQKIVSSVKNQCDIILCLTTGGGAGMTAEERLQTVTALSPELASFNAGSVNFGIFPLLQKHQEWKYDWEPCNYFEQNGTKPELEVYDVGMLNNIAFLIRNGYLKKPVYLQFVMGILGGIPAGPENLIFLLDSAKKLIGEFEFSVCVAGKEQFPMCTHSLLMGGHARVGLEDNLWLEKGVMAKSNAEQVKKLIRIMGEFGIEPASADEARQILGLKGQD